MTSYPTAVELFKQFMPRFADISLVRNGWGADRWGPYNEQCFFLKMHRELGGLNGYSYSRHIFLDVAASGMSIDFRYDRTSEKTLHQQLEDLVASQVEEMLKGRTFKLELTEQPTSLVNRFGFQELPFTVSMNGDPVPGLHLPKEGSGYKGIWRVFIPEDTPESKAVWAAHTYEQTQRLNSGAIQQQKDTAEAAFTDALKLIAA
jgi:hypothetical protein